MSEDTISRQMAIDVVEESRRLNHHQDGKAACAHEYEHRHFLKLLRDLPSAQPEPCEDTISRKAAIELVKDVCDAIMSECESRYDPEIEDEVYTDIREVDAILKCNKEMRIALRNIPSAQSDLFNNNILSHPQCTSRTKWGNCDPVGGFCTSVPKEICDEQKHEKCIDEDLISREAVIHELNNSHYPGAPYVDAGINIAIGKVCDAPNVKLEIVRCKDCKHWKQQTNDAGIRLSFGFCENDNMWRSLYGETYEVAHIDTDEDFYCGYAERKTNE